MKQQLWIINSSFITFFILTLVVTNLLKIETPRLPSRSTVTQESQKKKESTSVQPHWDKIYKNDIFNTFSPVVKQPVKQDFVTPIPEPKEPTVVEAPDLPKQDFIEPLKITVKGIIVADDEAQNVAMVEDETQKESLYHLGEKIKDAQVIKITKNRIVLLRGNGQQEIFYLRKEGLEEQLLTPEKWLYIIKKPKEDEKTFEIDPDAFKTEVQSLGNLLERCAIIGTTYHKGKPTGIKIGSLEKDDVGMMLGLQNNDIITEIAKIPTSNMKNRIKIFDHIKALNINDSFDVVIQRNNNTETLTYKLTKISKAKQQIFTGEKTEPKKKEEGLKLSKIQEREKLVRDFNQRHTGATQHKEAIARIRQRLLENLKNRLKDARVR